MSLIREKKYMYREARLQSVCTGKIPFYILCTTRYMYVYKRRWLCLSGAVISTTISLCASRIIPRLEIKPDGKTRARGVYTHAHTRCTMGARQSSGKLDFFYVLLDGDRYLCVFFFFATRQNTRETHRNRRHRIYQINYRVLRRNAKYARA